MIPRWRVAVALLFAGATAFAGVAEPHVDGIVRRILGEAAKVRAADPSAVPMAFWDIDGTIIKGDSGLGLVEDGQVRYRGLIQEVVERGLVPTYRGPDAFRRWYADYQYMLKIGPWLAQSYDAQMFAGVSEDELDAFCARTIRELRLDAWYFASSMAIWKALDAAGVENHVVSANIDAVVRNLALTLKIPRGRIRGVRVAAEGGRWTTRIVPPVPHGEGKTDAVREIVLARPHGVAVAAFGNSYSTDGPFLRYVATQAALPGGAKGTAVMINGGKAVPGFTEHFICVEQDAVVGNGDGSAGR